MTLPNLPRPWWASIADAWADAPEGAPEPLAEAMGSAWAGNVSLARRQLGNTSLEPDLAYLGAQLGWLLEVERYNTFPGGVGADAVDLTERWDGRERLQAHQAAHRDAWTNAGRGARTIGQLLGWVPGWRSITATVRSASSYQAPEASRLLEMLGNQIEGQHREIEGLGPTAQRLVARTGAFVLGLSRQRGPAADAWSVVLEEAERVGDAIAEAAARCALGDLEIAPVSGAHLRNLYVADASFVTGELLWTIESDEGALPEEGGALDVAEAHYRAALEGAGEAGLGRAVDLARLRLAHLFRCRGNLEVAVLETKTARDGFRSRGDVGREHLSTALLALAQLDAGQPIVDDLREVGAWGAGDGSFSFALGIGILLTRAARQALIRQADPRTALRMYEFALGLNQALGATFRISQCHADISEVHRILGNRDRAQLHQDQASGALGEASATSAEALQRQALLTQQQYREAQEHRDAAGMLAAARRIDALVAAGQAPIHQVVANFLAETRRQASVLVPLYEAVECREAGDAMGAERGFARALEVAREQDGAEGWRMIAIVHGQRGDHDEAVAAFDRFLELEATGFDARMVASMADMSAEQGALERQLHRRRSAEKAFSFMVQVRAFDRARAYLDELEAIDPDWALRDPRPWQALANQGDLADGLGDPVTALDHYERALEAFERMRRSLNRDELKTALDGGRDIRILSARAVAVALRLARAGQPASGGRDAGALAVALSERGRARALLDLVAGPAGNSGVFAQWRRLTTDSQIVAGLVNAARRGWEGSEARVEALQAELGRLERAVVDEEQRLQAEVPRAATLLGASVAPPPLDTIRDRLPADTALLVFQTQRDQLLAWTIDRDGLGVIAIRELGEVELGRRVRAFYRACAEHGPLDEVVRLGELLAGDLLEPLKPTIDRCRNLIVVPHGDLHRVPFAALRWEGDWLGARRTLSTLPSASLLVDLVDADRREAAGALVVGNPARMAHHSPHDGSVEPLNALAHAEVEAAAVARVHGEAPLVGPAATREAVMSQLAGRRTLHFATHGLLDDRSPLSSAIALADGEVVDVSDLVGVDLVAELVVLSACRSALGRRTGGEEILGLTRALLAAGARGAVVTLWAVWDDSTAVAMVALHEGLAKHGAADALREAQRRVRAMTAADLAASVAALRDLPAPPRADVRSGDHPQLWAPFVHVGVPGGPA